MAKRTLTRSVRGLLREWGDESVTVSHLALIAEQEGIVARAADAHEKVKAVLRRLAARGEADLIYGGGRRGGIIAAKYVPADADRRSGKRRVDITLGLHLDGDDVDVDTGAIIAAVEELLEGASVYAGPRRSSFVIDHVDDPVHVHSVADRPDGSFSGTVR